MTHSFGDIELQGLVIGHSYCRSEYRVRVVPYVRSAERGNARWKTVGKGVIILRCNTRDAVAVRVILLEGSASERRVLWRCDLRLVERQRNRFVNSDVPYVADCYDHVVAGLPLQIERPVFRVGQPIFIIVAYEQVAPAALHHTLIAN